MKFSAIFSGAKKFSLPCGTKFLREFIFLRIGDFLCFAGTNFYDEDRLVFLAEN